MSIRKLPGRADPLFQTHAPAILEIWDRMQRLQVDFCLAQELSFYYSAPEWHAAQSVLDLGTGNGYYLRRVAAYFPDKSYHGVDASAELIAIARRDAGVENVSFAHEDLFSVTNRYDFVLMRLLLQHQDDVRAVLDHVATLTESGGAALIIDSHDPLRFFYPELPEYTVFFAAYVEHERKAGRERCVTARVDEAIACSTKWRAAGAMQLLIPSTIPGNLELFSRTYTSLVDLVEQVGELRYDFAAVKEAWRRWSERPDAYTQVGLNLICIRRV
jgi:SAM-dependent methyltransferase